MGVQIRVLFLKEKPFWSLGARFEERSLVRNKALLWRGG